MSYPSDFGKSDLELIDEFELEGAPEHKSKAYSLRGFSTPLRAEAALYALRMLRCDHMYRRVFERTSYIDRDILILLGITDRVRARKERVFRSPRVAVARQREQLEKASDCDSGSLTMAIAKLGAALQLSDTERRVLRLAVVATHVPGFSDLFTAARLPRDVLTDVIGRAIAVTGASVRKALHPEHTLGSGGFFETSRPLSNTPNPLELSTSVCEALLSSDFEVETLLRHLVRRSPPARLTLEDYSYVRDTDLMQRYLARATTQRQRGTNILLYGAPGTGKTEFVRALAAGLGLQLYEVPNEDEDRDEIDGQRRFASYALCQKILAGRDNQMILFDEVEDVFGTGHSWMGPFWNLYGDREAHRLGKSWTNERLETNPVPTIWVCNTIGAMDAAYLRRFDMTVEFRAPGRAATRRLVARYFRPGEISDACIERLASIERLPPSQVERAARVVRTLGSANIDRRDAEVLRLVEASLRAMGVQHATSVSTLPPHYDPAFIHADRDLEALVEGLTHGAGARLCFYGPPGTGKTAFAHYVAKALGLPIRVKRSSDLLSPYVGMTEQLIADAFQSAADEGAILLIDEADGFLRDRGGARQSWEVTQVNELLTQMEAFEGIFIASTNLVDTLDAASLRRFDFKVKFDYLTREQRLAMLARVATEASATPDNDERARHVLDRIEWLAPGDFANALRQLRVTGEPATPARVVKLLEAEAVMKPEGRRHAVGFVT